MPGGANKGLFCERQEGIQNGGWMGGGRESSLKWGPPFSVVPQYPAREEESCDGTWGGGGTGHLPNKHTIQGSSPGLGPEDLERNPSSFCSRKWWWEPS